MQAQDAVVTVENVARPTNEGDFWIFGYGSLLWRPSFPFKERVNGYIKGYLRTFFQGSTDHRGIPGSPGRVVTLLPKDHHHTAGFSSKEGEELVTWGAAFCVDSADREEVISYLDYREKGGYTQSVVDVYTKEDCHKPFCKALIYMATPDNEEYLGPATMEQIADQIIKSHGPSGPNIEYLLNLAEALRSMEADDSHVFELERKAIELHRVAEELSR
ncbi:hypothetical protein PROFUN_05090 [Planoprotostelium fungivorum]|uniref:glutathione-specific gamma-glutamylcyclotransferase n=1 Tax=Planoprotostelium fungivorum TaxID=1890364 RepID=A0A2P6NRN3_9EUKA|nr:hypothetical protein PROFUN_05090 [Planoprotostelium fungivorum]